MLLFCFVHIYLNSLWFYHNWKNACIYTNPIVLKSLEKNILKRVVGQKKAVEKISDILIRSYAGIASSERPAGSFIFLGPTGVGKTLTSHVLAEELFDEKDSLIRIDMSEFSEKHTKYNINI